jgi:hypothetical protein
MENTYNMPTSSDNKHNKNDLNYTQKLQVLEVNMLWKIIDSIQTP